VGGHESRIFRQVGDIIRLKLIKGLPKPYSRVLILMIHRHSYQKKILMIPYNINIGPGGSSSLNVAGPFLSPKQQTLQLRVSDQLVRKL
jgi:hypothetical protein